MWSCRPPWGRQGIHGAGCGISPAGYRPENARGDEDQCLGLLTEWWTRCGRKRPHVGMSPKNGTLLTWTQLSSVRNTPPSTTVSPLPTNTWVFSWVVSMEGINPPRPLGTRLTNRILVDLQVQQDAVIRGDIGRHIQFQYGILEGGRGLTAGGGLLVGDFGTRFDEPPCCLSPVITFGWDTTSPSPGSFQSRQLCRQEEVFTGKAHGKAAGAGTHTQVNQQCAGIIRRANR